MKPKLLIILLFLIFNSSYGQVDTINDCNTLKWKTTQLFHCYYVGDDYYLDTLEGKSININKYNPCYFAYEIENVSNDTFFQNENIHIYCRFAAHVDTGYLDYCFSIKYYFKLEADKIPNFISIYRLSAQVDPSYFYSKIEENTGVTPDKIDYWSFYCVVYHSDKDGYYSDSIINLGKMETTFKFTEGDNIKNYSNSETVLLYPNPANYNLTVENENIPIKDICLYNLMGQKVKHVYVNSNEITLDVNTLPAGIYIAKINTEQ